MKLSSARRVIFLLLSFGMLELSFAQPILLPEEKQDLQINLETSSDIRVLSDHILDIGSFEVDNSNREEVRTFFNAIYWASVYATIDWTGSFSPFPGTGTQTTETVTPLAGDTSELFKEAVLLRINYYRAMAGVPADIVLLDEWNRIAQSTALIMGGNDNISHFPDLSGLPNYLSEDGIQGAADSNLAIGSYGPDSVNSYMQDKGSGNTSVGHRRWLLFPPMKEMGTGDTPAATVPDIPQAAIDEIDDWLGEIAPEFGGPRDSVRRANAIHIFSNANFGPHPEMDFAYVAFPQEGYVPYHNVHPRWSFSIKDANFKNATVTMTRDTSPINVIKEELDPDPDNPNAGSLGDNTLVWVYDDLDAGESHTHPKPDNDVTYQVTISGIQNAPQTSYTYNVIVFDPEVPTVGETTVTTVTGPAQVEVGTASNFDVALPNFATLPTNENVTGIRYRSFTPVPGGLTENADSGESDSQFKSRVVVRQFGDYSVIEAPPAPNASGNAFHLATDEIGTNQSMTFPDAYVIGDSSSLSFESMVRAATDSQFAKVNVSLDNGISWLNVFSQAGQTPQEATSGSADENSFTGKSVDLSSFEGRTIHIQFAYDHTGGSAFTGSDSFVGWYFDDIELTGVQSINAFATSDFLSDTDTFDFTASTLGDVALQAQGMLHGVYEMEWGEVLSITAVASLETVTANDDTNSIDEGEASVSGSLLTNDEKPADETLTVDRVNDDAGNVGTQISTTYGTLTISANGDYTYELDNANATVMALGDGESLQDSATYRAIDGQSQSDSATLTITINGMDVTAGDDEDAIDEGGSYVTGSLLDNDGAPDGETLTVTQVDGETGNVGTRIKTDHGYLVIAPDGSYAYQVDNDDPDVANLNDGESIEEVFLYTIESSQSNGDEASLRIVINGATTVDSSGTSQVVNISTRSEILAGDSAMIAGFTVFGSDPLDVTIVSEGPNLAGSLSGAIENPTIELFKTDFSVNPPTSSSVDIPQNPNTVWGGSTELSDAMVLVRGRSLPTDSLDAAMRATLTQGVYTLIVKGVDDGTGIGTVEVYDESYKTDPDADATLFNIATRAFVGSEQDSAMIAGFTVIGDKPQKALIRAQGPGVALPAGTTALPNPNIKVVETFPSTVDLHENDDWGDAENNMAEILLVAAAVNSQGYVIGSPNSAMVVDLEPNRVYSVILSGGAGESGVALVEVFAPTDL